MNKIKSVVVALALAGAASSGLAVAADVSQSAQTLTLTDGAGVFSHIVASGNSGATFTDRYNFPVTGAGVLGAQVAAFSPMTDGISITGFSLYDTAGLSMAGTQVMSGATDLWTVSTNHLMSDNYYLLVSGTVLSSAATSYAGTLSVSAVPEPATYGMLLGGLGVLGLAWRRRRGGAAR